MAKDVLPEAPAPDPLWQVPAEMVRLAREGHAPTSDQMDVLRAYLDLRTVSFACSDDTGELRRCEHPGYLRRAVAGRAVFVPFHLARFFPGNNVLNSIVEVADAVTLASDNPICISGSTTFLTALPGVGDLDFCEYHLSDTATLCDRVQAKVERSDEDGPPLVEVKCGAKHHHPWFGLREGVRAETATSSENGRATAIKLDFLSNTRCLGLLPTTSVVLPLGEDPEAGNANSSFAYQEAVIHDGQPPRTLLRPESLGRYALWLLEDARRWLTDESKGPLVKRGPKGLKRLLSLAMLIGATALVNEVVSGLSSEALADVTTRGRLDELELMLSLMPETSATQFGPDVDALRDSLSFEQDEIDTALEVLIELGQLILEDIELLLDPSGADA